jgi:long-chain acyl-CoA synthetase
MQDLIAQHKPEDRPKVEVSPDDNALFQYSGGTTGISKAAVAMHRNLVANALQIRLWMSAAQDGQETVLMAIRFSTFTAWSPECCLPSEPGLGW